MTRKLRAAGARTPSANRYVHLDYATLGATGAVPPALDADGIRLRAIRRDAP